MQQKRYTNLGPHPKKQRVEIHWDKYLALWFPFLMGISVFAAVQGAYNADKYNIIRGLLIGLAALNLFFTYQWVMFIYVRIHGAAVLANARKDTVTNDA